MTDLLASEAGRPLPPATRREMAARFGRDFGGVRVHDGPAAARTADELDAAAYTVGSDVVFGEGFDPERVDARLLLAHELAHVVQRAGAGAPDRSRPAVSRRGDPIEIDATRATVDVARGVNPSVQPYAVPLVARAGPSWLEETADWWRESYGTVGDVAGEGSLLNELIAAGSGSSGLGSRIAGGGLGYLGFLSGVSQMADPASSTGDVVLGGLNAYSGGIGFLGSIFPGLAAGGTAGTGATALGSGALGAGGAWGSLGAGLGSAGAVVGSGLAGYAIGRGLDEGVGALMNWTGASDWLDELQGISRPAGQHGDYSISGMGSSLMLAQDEAFTGAMRSLGVYDESRPAYTQTIGWQLAEILPSWMQ